MRSPCTPATVARGEPDVLHPVDEGIHEYVGTAVKSIGKWISGWF